MASRSMRNLPQPKVNTHTLAGLVWTEKYSCYKTTVAKWLLLEFSYHKEGYEIEVAGLKLVARPDSAEAAADLAVRAAKLWMSRASAELDAIVSVEDPTKDEPTV